MVINGYRLIEACPIREMRGIKIKEFGVSYGLAEVGYDIRLKQEILFIPGHTFKMIQGQEYWHLQQVPEIYVFDDEDISITHGNFTLASSIEEFQMPEHLVGIVHDKSTWARQGLSVFNTVIEPGWNGFLTLELAFRGNEPVHIPAGAGIAQVIFHQVIEPQAYSGKYQNQDDRPVQAILA